MPHVRAPAFAIVVAAAGLLFPAAASAQQAARSADGLRPPTAAERKQMSDAMRAYTTKDTTGLRETQGVGGATLLHLNGRAQSVSVAERTAGGVEATCVASETEAKAFAAGKHAHAKQHTPAVEEK